MPHSPSTRGGHRAELTLPGEQLAERVADVDHLDVGCVDLGRRQCGGHHLGGQIGEVMTFPGEVAGEIALIPAENPNAGSAHDHDFTTTKRVTRRV